MRICWAFLFLGLVACSDGGNIREKEAETLYLRAVALEAGSDQDKVTAYSTYGRLRTEYLDTRFAQLATTKAKALEPEYLSAMTREAQRSFREGANEAALAARKR